MRKLISHSSASRRGKIEIIHLSFVPPTLAAEWRLIMFDANAKKYAVLGYPIGHSLSPYIHHNIFAITGYNGVYTAYEVPPDKLEFILPYLKEYFCGFNCTIPHKEKIIPYLDELDVRANWCRSVNTVKIQDGRMVGYSTDGIGMVGALELEGISLDKKNVLITGAGGVARVALFETLFRECNVMIAARNLEKAEILANDAIKNISKGRVNICDISDIRGEFDILLQCTPVGMYPDINTIPVNEELLGNVKVVFDTIYNPKDTMLLKKAGNYGVKAIGGINMLILQALAAQEIWRNTKFVGKITEELIKRTAL